VVATQEPDRLFEAAKGGWSRVASANQDVRRLAPNFRLKSFPDETNLTPREQLVLSEIVKGLTSKEIGRTLDISSRTVEFHRANLLKKYGARNTADLVRKVLGE
jgi:DNA-binding NarL/FixJ family response regulator